MSEIIDGNFPFPIIPVLQLYDTFSFVFGYHEFFFPENPCLFGNSCGPRFKKFARFTQPGFIESGSLELRFTELVLVEPRRGDPAGPEKPPGNPSGRGSKSGSARPGAPIRRRFTAASLGLGPAVADV
jgi:hypothetical protein